MTIHMMKSVADRLGFGLSRELWLVVFGMFLNYLGYGAVLPFEIIYLHDGRGFSLGIAGLVVGLLTGGAVVVSPLVGSLIDRFGARATMTGAGMTLAAGYAGLAFADTPAVAFGSAVLAGIGNGALGPSQSTLLAALAPPEIRHRVTAVSRVASNSGIGLGSALGGLVATHGLNGFVLLFLGNALSYLIYVFVLMAAVRNVEALRPEPITGGYRLVVRDRASMHLALTNVAMIAVGWGMFTWLLPPYAEGHIGLPTNLIGLLLLANAVTVVVVQVPVARFAEGRRRVMMMTLAGAIFVFACLLVVTAGLLPRVAVPALFAAAIAVGVGECFHTTVLMPLVADLAPASLRGRYMAAIGLSWWVGLALAPTLGTPVLSLSPRGVFLVAAVLATLAALSALGLERRLPSEARLTPRPRGDRSAAAPAS